ncbi:MAG: carboxypeptidase regulatory-like domain-containing protein [Planctomycetota bacterium]|nr:carboxypeptidase regulatory-like domain-containing protein [Planctomycetota bacterium]
MSCCLRRCSWFAVPGIALFVASGCGSGNPDTAAVHGKVTYDGKPVPGGGLTFIPVADAGASESPGKPASAVIQSDGTYTLATYGDDDGAVIGKHKVAFQPPPPGAVAAPEEDDPDADHAAPPKPSEFAGMTPKEAEVEVKAGDNEINIELKK